MGTDGLALGVRMGSFWTRGMTSLWTRDDFLWTWNDSLWTGETLSLWSAGVDFALDADGRLALDAEGHHFRTRNASLWTRETARFGRETHHFGAERNILARCHPLSADRSLWTRSWHIALDAERLTLRGIWLDGRGTRSLWTRATRFRREVAIALVAERTRFGRGSTRFGRETALFERGSLALSARHLTD